MPEFHIPESRAKAAQRRKLSKVLAFVKRAQSIRLNTGCTIMPIPTTNKNMIAIAGSVANASNLIKFMCEIGLISIESDKYRFNSRRAGGNFSKKYRYYYENEVRLIEYCKQEGIKEHLTKNCQKKNEEALPAYLMISPENIAFSSRVRLVKPKNVSVAGFEENLTRCLYRKYPDLERYQKLADEINETYYTEYPELAIRFVPHLTWDKTKMYIKKIGIRATNQCVSASDTNTHDDNLHRMDKQELLNKYNLNLSKDVKSSVPRITLSLNQYTWEKESTDKQILMNPTYMGDLVFGRMPTALYLGQPDYHYEPDESKWRILPDMHEALVSRGDFYQVREILEAGRRENEAKLEASRNYREKHPQIFRTGIVRCGHCGSNLGYSRHGEKKEGRYNCRNKQYGRCDVAVGISEKKLAPIVWNAIQIQFALFADFEEVAGRLKDGGIQTKRQTELQQEMLEVSNQLSGYQNKREQLYNDYVDGILSAGDYIELKTRFDTAYQEQSSRLNQLSVELAKLNRMLSDENKWLVNIRNIRKARKLTPEIAQAMIDHINVYKTGYAQHRLEIIFRFQEERDALEAAYHELEGGEAR